MSKLKLVTSKLSPFGHRVEMTLIEKNIAFEKVEVDLANKPSWFVKDSPLGKAPILYCDDKVLFESIAICEYIEEISSSQPLHPQDQYLRAWNRGWIEFCNGLIASIFGIAMAQDEKNFQEKINETYQKIEVFEKHLNPNPFFNGESIALIDICFATAFVPMNHTQLVYGVELFNEDSKIFKYLQKLIELESAKKAIPSDYSQVFKNFLQRKNSYLFQIHKKL